jgi:hypothetical protein
LMVSSLCTNSVRFERMLAFDTSASWSCTMAPLSVKSIPHITSAGTIM